MADEADFDSLDNERRGAIAGLNPMFGEWEFTFPFAPIPYGSNPARRKAFKENMQDLLSNKWVYSHDVRVEITLFLDTQKVLETSDTADLDNYAKSILDGLKGAGGIMFDDTQVQSLTISWVDNYEAPSFKVSATSSPDDFTLKPVEFYEMPDGLWYPLGSYIYGDKEDPYFDVDFSTLSLLEMMSKFKYSLRIQLRNHGLDRLRAFQGSKWPQTPYRGYHRSRIQDSGFRMNQREVWQRERDIWKQSVKSFDIVEDFIEAWRADLDELGKSMIGK